MHSASQPLHIAARSILLAGSLAAAAATALGWSDSPSAIDSRTASTPKSILKNSSLEAWVMHPDEQAGFYRDARFVHAGIVAIVRADENLFIGTREEGNIHPTMGLSDEFVESLPLREANDEKLAEAVRIGVGRVSEDPQAPVDKRVQLIEILPWTMEKEPHGLLFRQVFNDPGGVGYEFVKTVELHPRYPRIRIGYALTNTGTRSIYTTHYNHNWLRPNDRTSGEGLELIFPYNAADTLVEEIPKMGAKLAGDRVRFEDADRPQPAYWLELAPRTKILDNTFQLIDRKAGLRISVENAWPEFQHKVYVDLRGICPESFKTIKLDPGESASWYSDYWFEAD